MSRPMRELAVGRKRLCAVTLVVAALGMHGFGKEPAASVAAAPAQKAAAGRAIAIGPYVQNVGRDRATICWATLDGEAALAGPRGKRLVPRYQVHEQLIGGLRPGTTYHYDVLRDGTDDGKGSFTTFPGGLDPFHFVVVGDTRSNHDTHQAIVDQIVREEPLLVINTGDLVSNGRNMADWQEFFRINRRLMRGVPYYPTLGNHENDSPFYFDFFSLPQNERYYTFSVGDALFLVLDVEGTYYDTPRYMDEKARQIWWARQNLDYMRRQKAWVDKMLTLNDSAGYIFVVLHEPLISVKRTRVEDAKQRRAFWDGLFERHRVSVVFSGHDHFYHRAVVGPTQHITTAGGGAGLYDPDTPAPETRIVRKVNHYCRVDVGERRAKITAIELGGEIIETVVIERR